MANLKITPDYSVQHTCHFCKRKNAVEGKEEIIKCYYFEKAFHIRGSFHKYKYNIAEVAVPRCAECENKSSKSSLINLIIFLICFIIGVIIWYNIFTNKVEEGLVWKNFLIACGPSFLCSLIITYILSSFVESMFERKYHFNFDYDGYSPITRLKFIGYVPRDSAPGSKSYDIKERGPMNMESYKKAVAEIIRTDNCNVSEI